MYQGAASKVSSELCSLFCTNTSHDKCLQQEEYSNTSSLEQRLQNVARTFVSQRPRQHQTQQPQSRPGSAGLAQQMPSYLSNGFSTGNAQAPFTHANFSAMMPSAVPQRPGSAGPGQSSQQQHSNQLPSGQAQGTQNSQRLGMSQASPVLANNQPGPVNSMPMASQSMAAAQSPAQSRDQPNLASPNLATADSNMVNMGLAAQQQAAMLRSQQGPAANGPLMSNGKPALLRGPAARDGVGWAQGPAMVSLPCKQLWDLVQSVFEQFLMIPMCCCRLCQMHSPTTGCFFIMV